MLFRSGEFMPFDLSSLGISVEAHLMTKDPRAAGDALASAGVSCIIGHIEAFASPQEAIDTLASWRAQGAQAGLAILMQTPLATLAPVAEACDVIQMMCIDTIGAQGAPFDQRSFARLGQLHAMFPKAALAVDGGVSHANIVDLAHMGARRFLVGSAIMKQPDPARAYEALVATLRTAVIT